MTSPAVATCAIVGSLLIDSEDVLGASSALESYVREPTAARAAALRLLGVDDVLARDLAAALPSGGEDLSSACEAGVAWALGRRSVEAQPTWEPVLTTGDITDDGIDRLTAETLIGLVVGARKSVRLFSAYIDSAGLDVLRVSLAAATRRGVDVKIGYSIVGDKGRAAEPFTRRISSEGEASKLRMVGIGRERPFPHLKLLAVDGTKAYIGSANLTWPALTSNVEFGALVLGKPVLTLERSFDALIDPPEEEQRNEP